MTGARTAGLTAGLIAVPMVVPTAARTAARMVVPTAVRTAVPTAVRTAVRTVARTAGPMAEPTEAPEQRPNGGGAVPEVDRPALRRCVNLPPEKFAEAVWGQQAHLSPGEQLPAGFDDLLTPADVDHLVSRQGLRTPFLRVARAGATLPASRFTRPGGVGAAIGDQVGDDQLTRLFADGATIVLQGLHRTWSPLIDFAQQLAADLGHPVQINAYITPPESQGFSAHYDVHDVFVLQVAGCKRWQIHAPVHPAPARDDSWTDHREAVRTAAAGSPLLDAVLRPGDTLYLPRGFLHSAQALGETSVHLTVGVHPWTRQHVLEHLLAELATDPELRTSLPVGVDLTTPDGLAGVLDQTVDALRAALFDVEPAAVAARMRGAVQAAGRAEPVGPIAQRDALAAVHAASRLRWRRHLPGRVETGGPGDDQIAVHTPEARVILPGHAAEAVARLLSGEVLEVRELGGPDDAARLRLARTLLAQALVVVPGSAGT